MSITETKDVNFAVIVLALAQLVVARLAAPPPLDPRGPIAQWPDATRAELDWDVQRGRAMSEPTVVHVANDGANLYVRFDAVQHEPIVATQRANDSGQGTDDGVWIDIWPMGASGFQYQFAATPNGTHYQSSSENSNYAPLWDSFGSTNGAGYTVTMKIPFSAMRGTQNLRWNVQFVRYVRANGQQAVWSYDSAQTNPDDLTRAGTMSVAIAAPPRLIPRIATYILGAGAAKSIGGSTSRAGMDLSYPVTGSTSLYATFHPDYSNVELDQQTIVPSVYPRAIAEVRPFFTQGSNNFNQQYCNFCNAFTPLYTPAIPTPASGYAVEGRSGDLAFTAFDAIGDGRNDRAAGAVYASSDQRWTATFNRVDVTTPAFNDHENVFSTFYNDLKHWTIYANYGNDSGTNVVNADRAQYYDTGATWSSQNFSAWAGIHRIGSSFHPADSFITLNGVNGWGLFLNKIWTPPPQSALAAFSIGGEIVRNHSDDGPLNQTVNLVDADFLTRSGVDVNLTSGSSYQMLQSGILTPTSQRGIALTLHSGLQTNNPVSFDTHGPSSTPTTISFNTGRYGGGRLDSWIRSSTMRVGARGLLSLALDETAQYLPSSSPNVQWFERAGYTYQLSSESSLGLGVRLVMGTPPEPNGGGNCVGRCSNVSGAYYLRLRHTELYFAYGDPGALVTTPQLILKAIFYTGADKGT